MYLFKKNSFSLTSCVIEYVEWILGKKNGKDVHEIFDLKERYEIDANYSLVIVNFNAIMYRSLAIVQCLINFVPLDKNYLQWNKIRSSKIKHPNPFHVLCSIFPIYHWDWERKRKTFHLESYFRHRYFFFFETEPIHLPENDRRKKVHISYRNALSEYTLHTSKNRITEMKTMKPVFSNRFIFIVCALEFV